MGAASARVFELSRNWSSMGHEVTVLTCFPNYPEGRIYDSYARKGNKFFLREKMEGIKVIRTYIYPTHYRSSLRRGLNYLSFLISSSSAIPFLREQDIIIATSPSLFAGLSGFFCSRYHRIPLVFEVRDLWPEVIQAMGAGSKDSMAYRIFDHIASLLYKKSDLIVTVTESFKETIVAERGIYPGKIEVIENAVDTDFFKPGPPAGHVLGTPRLKGKFIVSYIGTIGYTHGAEIVIKAAEALKKTVPDLVFLFVGDGSDKERLSQIATQKGLINVIFVGKQPKDKIPDYINSSDVSLVLSTNEPLLRKTIFAKIFEPMACGKPLIAGAPGETENIVINRARAGVGFEPEDVDGFIEAVMRLYKNPELRRELGRNGRCFVVDEFSRSKKATDYLNTIKALINKRKSL